MAEDLRLAVVGTGRLGEALLRGLLRAGWVEASRVTCTARRQERADALSAEHGVHATTDNRAAVAQADVVVVGLKPQVLLQVLGDSAEAFRADQTVISLAAGTTTASIEALLPAGTPVVRVMTNTPVLVDEAMSVVAAGTHAGPDHLALAEQVMGHVGRVVRLGEEHFDAVTAVSGSGPAYVFLVAEAMIDAAVAQGLPRDVAADLVVQTVLGAGRLLGDSGMGPAELREMVTSPGGTTMAAIGVLESAGLRPAFLSAIEAARRRGEELGRG